MQARTTVPGPAARLATRRKALRALRLLGALIALTCSASAEAGWLERDTLTGDWNGTRPALAQYGFKPYVNYTGILWSDVAGGERTGTDFVGYLDFGFDLDLARLGAWQGLGFRATAHWYEGPGPTISRVGGLEAMALSGWEASNAFRVYDLYFRQSLADGRLLVKLGQLAADSDFMLTRFGGLFLNAAFGDLPEQNLNIDAPVYPLAAPGLYVKAKPVPWLVLRGGVYTGDSGEDVARNHGFGWRLGAAAGWSSFAEVGVLPSGPDGSAYTMGAVYDTGGHEQFGGGIESGVHYELYWMIDQVLAADDKGSPLAGAFARFSVSPQSDRSVVGLYGDAGLNVFGPIAARPQDTAGLGLSILRFTGDFQRMSIAQGFNPGGGEALLELTYQAAIAPWLSLQPDVQLFLTPPLSQQNAVVFGIQAAAVF